MHNSFIRKYSALIYVCRRIFRSLNTNLVFFLYGPRRVMDISKNCKAKILRKSYDSKTYYVANIHEGLIFSNRINNISVFSGGQLVPHVSWQWDDNQLRILPDNENFLLTKKLSLESAPKYIGPVIVSLLTGMPGNNNYYHWLFDCLTRIHLSSSFIHLFPRVQYLIPDDTYPFQKQTLKELGITSTQYVTSREMPFIAADSVIATSYPNPVINEPADWSIRFLRNSFIHLRSNKNSDNKFLYISRRDSLRSRRLSNENYLLSLLIPLGFKIMYLSEIDFTEQVSLFANAKMVVGVHGAGLANLIFAKKSTVVFEIFSQDYQPKMYQKISRYLKLDYHSIVCQTLAKPLSSSLFNEVLNPQQIYQNNVADLAIADADALAIYERAKELIEIV